MRDRAWIETPVRGRVSGHGVNTDGRVVAKAVIGGRRANDRAGVRAGRYGPCCGLRINRSGRRIARFQIHLILLVLENRRPHILQHEIDLHACARGRVEGGDVSGVQALVRIASHVIDTRGGRVLHDYLSHDGPLQPVGELARRNHRADICALCRSSCNRGGRPEVGGRQHRGAVQVSGVVASRLVNVVHRNGCICPDRWRNERHDTVLQASIRPLIFHVALRIDQHPADSRLRVVRDVALLEPRSHGNGPISLRRSAGVGDGEGLNLCETGSGEDHKKDRVSHVYLVSVTIAANRSTSISWADVVALRTPIPKWIATDGKFVDTVSAAPPSTVIETTPPVNVSLKVWKLVSTAMLLVEAVEQVPALQATSVNLVSDKVVS